MKFFVVGVIFFHVASAILEDNNAGPTSRIVGGNTASQGQFPYQVALMLSGSLFCGATWIKTTSTTRITVLTAAHCIDFLSTRQLIGLQVVFGLHDRSDINDIGTVVFKPNALTIHKEYDERTYSNDVATIVINTAPSYVESVSWARPIELTDTTYSEGELGTASGWGTLESGGAAPYILHYVTKPVLSLSSCMATSYDPSAIDITMMCCGEAGKDSCQGDSGGPLVTTRGGKTKLIGVVSWGYGCGASGYPGVYADVNYHRDWIVANSG